jgi:putative toxin-antitoxin system antitoxin component (TIGR02293 family)
MNFALDTTCGLNSHQMRHIFASSDPEYPMSYLGVAVADLLGMKPKNQESPLTLAYSVEKGLPVSALEKFAGHVCPHDVRRFYYRVVPKPTLERRRREKKPLTTEESDRLARIAKVFAFALEIFHDEPKVRSFLERPHPMLDEKSPLEVALATGPGADAVINVLGRAAYSGGV